MIRRRFIVTYERRVMGGAHSKKNSIPLLCLDIMLIFKIICVFLTNHVDDAHISIYL